MPNNDSRTGKKMNSIRGVVVLFVACIAVSGAERASKDSLAAIHGAHDDCVIGVSPNTNGQPVIGQAVSEAHAGCTIRLRRGLYREIVTIAKPVSLMGEEGTVLDPSEPLAAKWESAEAFGIGVY